MALGILCALLGFCTSAIADPNLDEFHFIRPGFRKAGDELCKICYGDNDCLAMDQARCTFYTETSSVLREEKGPEDLENTEMRMQVDALLMDFIEQASPAIKECIPFISQYTDCTKENICLGCTSCNCTKHGHWNCSTSQRCRREDPLKVDHRALVIAMESMMGEFFLINQFQEWFPAHHASLRLKRSMSATGVPRAAHKITFGELADWMYEAESLNTRKYNNLKTEITTINAATEHNFGTPTDDDNNTVAVNKNVTTNIDPDHVAFEDVLNDNAIETENHTRRKILNDETDFEHDYMNLEDVNVTYNEIHGYKIADQFINILNAIEEENKNTAGETTTEDVTEVVIDLLDIAQKKLEVDDNFVNRTDLSSSQNYTDFEITNDLEEWNSFNIKKRDVSQIMAKKLDITYTEKPNVTNDLEEVKDGIFHPLNKVIQNRKEELEDLLHIRDNLVNILKFNYSNENESVLNKSKTIDHKNTTHYSFYNVEVIPQMEYELRRSDMNQLDKVLRKLKHDIFVVMGDIAAVQKLKGNLSQEIKILIRAMKHYVHKHGILHSKVAFSSHYEPEKLRRHWDVQHKSKEDLINVIINVLQVLDQNIPQNISLASMSRRTGRIFRDLIKNNNIEDNFLVGPRFSHPDYNLANDLKSIGSKLQDMKIQITDSAPGDKLDHMKLLQFVLESDITKIKDALALIDFAHSRRMIVLTDGVNEDQLMRINIDLRSMHSKLNKIIEYRNKDKQKNTDAVKVLKINKQNKKETFLKHVRNLLSNSKRDIMKLLHKKVPKSEIVKVLAKRNGNDLTKNKLIEYENVMRKWQNNLDINDRRRRSAVSSLKHILPKYLMGKVSPKLNSTKKTKNKSAYKPESRRNKKSQNKRNKNTRRKSLTVTTTLKVPVTLPGK